MLSWLPVSFHKGFAARASLVFAGSAGGQAIAFLLLPFTARVYGAETLGQAATVLAALGILALVICLQYDNAVIVASDSDIPYLLLLSWISAIASTVLVCALLVLEQWLLRPNGIGALAYLGIDWTLALLMLSYAPYLLLTNLQLRLNELHKVSVGRIIFYGGGALLQLICGLLVPPQASVYLAAQAAGAFLALSYLLPYARVLTWVAAHQQRRVGLRNELIRVACSYREFPQFQAGAGFLNALSMSVPMVFMRIAFSDAWAGWYYIAFRALASPTNLAGQAIGQVFYRDSADRERQGTGQAHVIEGIVSGLLRAGLLPALALGVFAPSLVGLLMGPDWAPVAVIVQALLVSFVVTFPTSPVSQILNVRRLQSRSLLFNAALFGARFIGLCVGYLFRSEIASVVGYSLASVLVFLPLLSYCVHSVGGSMLKIVRPVVPEAIDVGLISLLVLGLSWSGVLYQPSAAAVVLALIGAAAYREATRWGWRGVRTRDT